MSTYDNAADLDSEGIPVLEEPVNEDEGIMAPRDYPVAADDYGVTAAEQEVDEPLAQRVTREEPEILPGQQPSNADEQAPMLVPPDDPSADEDGMSEADTSEPEYGRRPSWSLSPEEAAVHME
ncbi:MAG: hypothetical protein DLM54_01270 [Acidimicrobiales bacterium]|nr:MAG: hypothetical protein DLM54_01270 [Acidimicrobiales bacterium]